RVGVPAAVSRTDAAPSAAPRPFLSRGRVEPTVSGAVRLPSWPLLAVLYGFPLFWVTGLTLFVPVTFGSIMMLFLVLRGGLRTTPGMLCWLAFLAWVVVCAISV